VVAVSAKKTFCAGADLKERMEMAPDDVRRFLDELGGTLNALAALLCPVIAALNGAAFGGGLELALACDIRIASADSRLGLTEVDLAIIPGGGGTQRLPRAVGRGKALEMILSAARIDAAEALRIGLIERMVPAGEALKAAQQFATTLAAKAPVALRYAKEAVTKGLEMSLADGVRLENDLATLLRTTEDRFEGAKAFLEKRKPRWQGR